MCHPAISKHSHQWPEIEEFDALFVNKNKEATNVK
jgi:hypothetical protein